jgi:hypothetical protein
MTPHNTPKPAMRFPAEAPPAPQTVQSGLTMLTSWRQASAATAIVMAALLPFAIAWHVSYVVAISAALVAGAILAFGCQLTRHRRLASLAIHPQFAHLPELAHTRRRLVSNRNRRALANGLRRTASPMQPPGRFDCCPVLQDRVAAVRPELLAIASALEQRNDPNPTSVALIHELLTNACSPLYNDNVPAADLRITLKRVRAGLTPEPPA